MSAIDAKNPIGLCEAHGPFEKRKRVLFGGHESFIQTCPICDDEKALIKAKAQAEANHLLTQSLSNNLVQYKAIEKWNGVMPQVTGNNTPFIDLRSKKE